MTEAKILVRPNRHRWERIDDYVKRLSKLNGWSSVDSFIAYLRAWSSEKKLCISDRGKYERVTQILQEYLDRSLEYMSFDSGYFIRWGGSPKLCRRCLDEEGVIFFFWYLKDYETCHWHKHKLEPVQTDDCGWWDRKDDNSRIKDFLSYQDPLAALSQAQKNIGRLEYLCESLTLFFSHGLNVELSIERARRWISSEVAFSLPIFEKLESVARLISADSGVLAMHVRLVMSLYVLHSSFASRYLSYSNYEFEARELYRVGVLGGDHWAAEVLMGSEPLRRFIAGSLGEKSSGKKIRLGNYMPYFSGLNDQLNAEIRSVINSHSCTRLLLLAGLAAKGSHNSSPSFFAREDESTAALG